MTKLTQNQQHVYMLMVNLVLTVHGHFINLCAVVLFNISQDPDIIILHKVDGNSSSTISPRATDSKTQRYNVRYNDKCSCVVLQYQHYLWMYSSRLLGRS